jgi:hypothetical protein
MHFISDKKSVGTNRQHLPPAGGLDCRHENIVIVQPILIPSTAAADAHLETLLQVSRPLIHELQARNQNQHLLASLDCVGCGENAYRRLACSCYGLDDAAARRPLPCVKGFSLPGARLGPAVDG